MRIRQWLSALLDRLLAMTGGALAARFQSTVLHEYADEMESLAERAARLEEAGHPELAANLKRLAGDVTITDPGAMGGPAIAALDHEEEAPEALPAPEDKPTSRRTRRTRSVKQTDE